MNSTWRWGFVPLHLDPRLEALDPLLTRTKLRMGDAEVEGRDEDAERLKDAYERLKQLKSEGHEYVPKF